MNVIIHAHVKKGVVYNNIKFTRFLQHQTEIKTRISDANAGG